MRRTYSSSSPAFNPRRRKQPPRPATLPNDDGSGRVDLAAQPADIGVCVIEWDDAGRAAAVELRCDQAMTDYSS